MENPNKFRNENIRVAKKYLAAKGKNLSELSVEVIDKLLDGMNLSNYGPGNGYRPRHQVQDMDIDIKNDMVVCLAYEASEGWYESDKRTLALVLVGKNHCISKLVLDEENYRGYFQSFVSSKIQFKEITEKNVIVEMVGESINKDKSNTITVNIDL